MSAVSTALDVLIAALLVLGGAFALIGSWGLNRLPSLMSRLHGPTKATTLGVGSCLIASMTYFPVHGLPWTAHELLIALFLFITAPISANMIAKTYIHGLHTGQSELAQVEDIKPPSPPNGSEWATFGISEKSSDLDQD
ncbi:Na+/H+ antiporter subunit G [Novosphingobium sp. RD2P27]|uniref:Na+/H+ antiporter subunit G n=1 Tax=Novosphingobium kalidii TaxID=3230299 RepID=A0ABV2D251_9SPHN